MREDSSSIPTYHKDADMRVGLTFDLKDRYVAEGYGQETVAEFDAPETIDAIDRVLCSMGHSTERIGNIKDLVSALAVGNRWDIVFNIAEGLHGLCREAQIPALLDAYRIPYVFSDSLSLVVTLHKGLAKAVVKEHGVPTADYQVVERVGDLVGIDLPFPLFIKPVGGGTGMGIDANSIVEDLDQLRNGVERLLLLHGQPVLVETYLTGREFTVGVVGTGEDARCIGVMEIVVEASSDRGLYSYQSKRHYQSCTSYRNVDETVESMCRDVALGAWRALGCRDGGRVDLRMDGSGSANFLEVNPLAGLHPVDSDLPILAAMHHVSYEELITMIMDSACKRLDIGYEETRSAIA